MAASTASEWWSFKKLTTELGLANAKKHVELMKKEGCVKVTRAGIRLYQYDQDRIVDTNRVKEEKGLQLQASSSKEEEVTAISANVADKKQSTPSRKKPATLAITDGTEENPIPKDIVEAVNKLQGAQLRQIEALIRSKLA